MTQSEFGEQNEQPSGSGMRAKLEEALAKIKAQDEELAKLRTADLVRSRADLLTAAGVPAEHHDLYSGDADEEKVKAWVAAKGKLFGLGEPPSEDAAAEATAREQQAAVQAAANVTSHGSPTSAGNTLEQASALVASGKATEADIDAMLASMFKK